MATATHEQVAKRIANVSAVSDKTVLLLDIVWYNLKSCFITEILPLKEFPDYIDYLPKGSIVRKIGVMGFIPGFDENITNPISLSRDEYEMFVGETVELVISKLKNLQQEVHR